MTEKDQDKARTPKSEQGQGLSRRDMDLARLEVLLAEQHLPIEIEEEDGAVLNEADEVNLDDAVEIAKLPPKPKAEPAVAATPPAVEAVPAPAPPSQPAVAVAPSKKKSGSVVGTLLKFGLLLLVLAAIFVFGVVAGRGHIMKSGPGHNLIVWIEQTTGLVPKPEKQAKPEDQKPEETPSGDETPAPPPGEEAVPVDPTPESEKSPTNIEEEEMPVWDWPGWTPPDLDEEETDTNSGASATPEASSSGLADSVGNPATAAAESGVTPSAGSSGSAQAEEDVLGDWPTAIEPDQTGLYTPPSDQEPEESVDYEAMLEPSEAAPDATYAEATPLPPAEVSGNPSLGKFAVQVEMASNENEAKNKVAALTKQGFRAYFLSDSKTSYRVRVGHFATRQQADDAKVRLEELGYEDPSVSGLTGTKTGG